jgi:hypothetical protein
MSGWHDVRLTGGQVLAHSKSQWGVALRLGEPEGTFWGAERENASGGWTGERSDSFEAPGGREKAVPVRARRQVATVLLRACILIKSDKYNGSVDIVEEMADISNFHRRMWTQLH